MRRSGIWLAGRGRLLGAVVGALMLVFGLAGGAAGASGRASASGMLKLSGFWAGTWIVTGQSGCAYGTGDHAINGKAGVLLTFPTLTLTVSGHPKTVHYLLVAFAFPRLGATSAIAYSPKSPTTLSIDYRGTGPVEIGEGVSGTVTTAANGSSGSVNAKVEVLDASGKTVGTSTMSGSWSSCTTGATTA